MQDNTNYSYISTVRTPDNGTHYVKDAEARAAITAAEERIGDNEQDIADIKEAIVNGAHFIGVTSTAVTDQSTNATVTVDGVNKVAQAGDFVICNKTVNGVATGIEFIWTGSKWSELGSTGTLKALAFKDKATASYKPTGSVSAPTINVTPTTANLNHLAASVDAETETLQLAISTAAVMTAVQVTANAPTFSGDTKTIEVT